MIRSDTSRASLGAKLAMMPGVRRVRRPVTPDGDRAFDLTYVRGGPPASCPLLVIPGGPGLASVLPYRSLRAEAAARGLDVIMVEHRGVGLSRRDDDGADLPRSALTVDQVVTDLAAVLDDCGVDRAVVYGSSYGTYLAQGLAVRHPERIAGMVLDSPMLTAGNEAARANLRGLLWDGDDPRTAEAARKLRRLVHDGVVTAGETGAAVQVIYEFGGPERLDRLLDLLLSGRGHRTWKWLAGLGDKEIDAVNPYLMEFDLVGVIAFRELGFGSPPDRAALDPGLSFAERAKDFPAFEGEPYDLAAALPHFDRPVAVVSGGRDLRTPRPVAERIAGLLPDGVLVAFDDLGHSVLDTHRKAALHVAHAVIEGTHRRLPGIASRIGALPRSGASRLLEPVLGARLAGERLLPPRRSPHTAQS